MREVLREIQDGAGRRGVVAWSRVQAATNGSGTCPNRVFSEAAARLTRREGAAQWNA
ncbi:hypothetical protein HOK021_30010 [Streptomyces hygroscopicus]|nr:hypothetical protein HOK021_30010 [Streptomyces hygroscopicus]